MFFSCFLCIFLYYIFFKSLPLFLIFFFLCLKKNFEQGHLEPWRYINAFIIIIMYYVKYGASVKHDVLG